MTPEEILEERNKIVEFKKKFAEYPLIPDECFKGINLLKTLDLQMDDLPDKIHPRVVMAILRAMKDACDQTVDLCAEKAEWDYGITDNHNNEGIAVDKQSILNVKNLIK